MDDKDVDSAGHGQKPLRPSHVNMIKIHMQSLMREEILDNLRDP
jgi:hypothetical protein